MMEKYKENNINKDIFYEEQKREKVKAAREEVLRKKREEAERLKLEAADSINVIEDKKEESEPSVESEPCVESEPSVETESEPVPEEEITEVVGNVDDDTKKILGICRPLDGE